MSEPFFIRLPASSANLGPGFDAVGVALDFHLEIEAAPAAQFSIDATGRDAERCARLTDNLVLDLYRDVLGKEGRPVVPLTIRMRNQIPLGMGCGSSAAGRLAALSLAVHFGELGWSAERILEEAVLLEGHPDNATACWHGGFVAAAQLAGSARPERVWFASIAPPAAWRAMVVLPSEPLATSKARAVLPESYKRADVVANLQAAALLSAAFAQGRGDLLAYAMRDRIHQPYRGEICHLLPPLLTLAGGQGILGVSLSGAGPAVLVIVESEERIQTATAAIQSALKGLQPAELVVSRFTASGTTFGPKI
ncbi:homoserine kinase [Terracidiphilus gabretensis]|uniref:homoserine kinase n=1 Tax=Terracidiphilus gabretensis TaxID=1577687 RepID=UPI00071B8A4F|nr:homoserine kinase [Terracidiphilus gabretensis]